MGFESYTVWLSPQRYPASEARNNESTADGVARAIIARWPEICNDDLQLADLPYVKKDDEIFLIHKSPLGWIQILIEPNSSRNAANISLRFAYCNPRTVVGPFCDMIKWAMRKYGTDCFAMSDFPREHAEHIGEITDPEEVYRLLVPSIDYNRKLWHLDAQSEEEVCCSPGEAVERFIMPHCHPI